MGKVIIVMPAFNVAPVLAKTVSQLPKGSYDKIIVVDDASSDATGEVAQSIGLQVVRHAVNTGYGGAQKTGYKAALELGADIIVMVHGDNQYDPSMVPAFVQKIREEGYEVVTGTRMVLGDALNQGMPVWKFIPNRFLTGLENFVFRTNISDYHNGFRAYAAAFLARVPLDLLSDKFDFDTDIMVQAAIRKCRIAEIPHTTRYTSENSQMSFAKGIRYGLSILGTVLKYLLHKAGLWKQGIYAANT